MNAPTSLTLEERLDRAESRVAIADVVHGYARAIRNGKPEDAAALFVKDGYFEICDGKPAGEVTVRARLEGREHYLVYLRRDDGRAPAMCPLLHNIMIEFDGPDVARGNAMLDALNLANGQRTVGEYHDHFRREDGRWYFAGRRFVIFSSGGA